MLGPAHKGYLFQDIVTAIYLARGILNPESTITVDSKHFANDRFDDLRIDLGATKIVTQIKHGKSTREFETSDLTQDRSGLRIDYLYDSWLAAFVSKGDGVDLTCRVITSWRAGTNLPDWLERTPIEEDFSLGGQVFSINHERLPYKSSGNAIQTIKGHDQSLVEKFCKSLVIELETPRASLNLDQPDQLENLLLTFLNDRIGVGIYPNDHLSPVNAAARLIHISSLLRSEENSSSSITGRTVIQKLGIKTDFGRIEQAFPYTEDSYVEANARKQTLKNVLKLGKISVLRAGPGSGKSWELTRLAKGLKERGFSVAQHYCYLSPTDNLSAHWVTKRALLSNLIFAVRSCVSESEIKNVPLYAATKESLQEALNRIPNSKPLAIIVDGLDHIDRIRAISPDLSISETDIVTLLAELTLPKNVAILIGSQPGEHLRNLGDNIDIEDLPPWNFQDTQKFFLRDFGKKEIEVDDENAKPSIVKLFHQSKGNPLYCAYLSRELDQFRWSKNSFSLPQFVDSLPPLDGTLETYYEHLLSGVSDGGRIILETLSLLEFAVNSEELAEIHPLFGSILEPTLSRASPVLDPIEEIRGIRIYHESFRRYILDRDSQLGPSKWNVIATWLYGRAFFESFRAYKHLISYLIRAERREEALSLLDHKFVNKSVEGAFPPELIRKNLSLLSHLSVQSKNYRLLGTVSELSSSLASYEWDLYDYEFFAEAACRIVGVERFCNRLSLEDRPVYSKEDGLRMCAIAHSHGGSPPWELYLSELTPKRDYVYTEDSLFVGEARFLAKTITNGVQSSGESLQKFISNERNGESVDLGHLERILKIYSSNGGSLNALRERANQDLPDWAQSTLSLREAKETPSPDIQRKNAELVLNLEVDSKQVLSALQLIDKPRTGEKWVESLSNRKIGVAGDRIIEEEEMNSWLIGVTIGAKTRPESLGSERTRVAGAGWYRTWLLFTIDLALEESQSSPIPPQTALELIKNLSISTHPFVGEPRACDLYSIRGCIHRTIAQCLRHLGADLRALREALVILRDISFETTSYLQNSPGGPLIPSDLVEICVSTFKDRDQAKVVLDELLPLVEKLQRGSTYPEIAQEKLRLCLLQFDLGFGEMATKSWKDSCLFLTAYGQRKDSTIDELLTPLLTLDATDSDGSYDRVRRLQPLVYSVYRHTDRKGTDHCISEWFKIFTKIFPNSAGSLLALSQASDNGPYDYRYEEGLTEFCENADLSDFHLFTNTLSLISDGLSEDLKKVALSSIKQGIDNPNVFSRLLSQLQGDATFVEQEEIRESLTPKNKQFSQDLWLPEKRDTQGNNRNSEPLQKEDAILGDLESIDIEGFKKLVRDQLGNYKIDTDDLLSKSNPYLVSFCSTEDTAKNFLNWARTDLSHTEGWNFIKAIARIADSNGWTRLASSAFVYAFTSASGGGGWYTLGDKQHHDLLKRAFELNPSQAERVFLAELDRLKGGRGVTRNAVSVLDACGKGNHALEFWEGAFSVICHRLPEEDLEGPFHRLPIDRDNSLDEEAAVFVTFSRISNPEDKRRSAAVAASAWCIVHRTTLVASSISRILQTEMRVDVLSTILELLWEYEPNEYVITKQGESSLKKICNEKSFLPGQIAAKLLARAGFEGPDFFQRAPLIESPKKTYDKQIPELFDKQGVLNSLQECWPELTPSVCNDFDDAIREENSVSRARSLYQMAHNSVHDNIPPASVISWIDIVFFTVLNRRLMNLKAKVFMAGVLNEHWAESTIARLRPETELGVKYQRSRIPRPNIPVHDEEGGGEIDFHRNGYGEFRDWIEIAQFEIYRAEPNDSWRKMGKTFFNCSGLVGIPPGFPTPEEACPLSVSDEDTWMTCHEAESSLRSSFGPFGARIGDESEWITDQLLGLAPGFLMQFDLVPTNNIDPLGYLDKDGNLACTYRWWRCWPIGGSDGITSELPRLRGGTLMMRRDLFENFLNKRKRPTKRR